MIAEADLQPENQLQHRYTIRLLDFLKAIASSPLDKVQQILHPR